MMYHTFSQLSYVANYGWLSILIIVLCDKLWLAVCYYHINYHFFLYYSKSIKYETFDKMCEKCVVLVSSRNIYIYIGATNGQTFMWKVDMFINAITLIFFTKVPHFFGKQRYEMLTNGKVQNKCKVGILGARFGHCVGGEGGQSLCFWMCQFFKKIEWVLFLPIVGVFWKEKKSTGFHGLIIYGVSMVIPNFQYLWMKPQSNLEFPKFSISATRSTIPTTNNQLAKSVARMAR